MTKTQSQNKRLFIAIDLPETVKAELFALTQNSGDIRWAQANQLHVTVYFLGSTRSDKIPEIKKIIQDSVKNLEEIDIKLYAVESRGKLVWVRVEDVNKDVEKLHFKLRKEFTKRGIGQKPTRNHFESHITLGRSKKNISAEHPAMHHARHGFSPLGLSVNFVSLFESSYNKEIGTHTYKELQAVKFGKSHTQEKVSVVETYDPWNY